MNILIFVKNMPYATPAISFGATIARLTQSKITLLFSSKRKKELKDGKQLLNIAARELMPDIPVETRTREGGPAGSIRREIESGDYDMVVLMARQALRFRERIGNKIGRKIAKEAPISTLVIKREQKKLERILICSSGQEFAVPVITTGINLANAAQAAVTILHVTTPIPSMYTGLDEIEETLPELLQTDTPVAQHLRKVAVMLEEHEVTGELELRHGDVTNEILREAEIGDYDLVIIGASAKVNQPGFWFIGNVTRHIVNHIQCPVLVVK